MSVPSCSSFKGESVSPIRAQYQNPRKRKNLPIGEENGPPRLTVAYPRDEFGRDTKKKLPKTRVSKRPLQATLIACDTAQHDIKMRLLRYHCPCNVRSLNCEFPMCGRSFSSVEVLAFHCSYAHHDVSSPLAATMCFVCGNTMESAKGKISHLTCRHKVLAAEHNEQCMAQREPVISPLAPAAIRLEENGRQRSSVVHTEDNIDQFNSSLSEICDMIVLPPEDEEDI